MPSVVQAPAALAMPGLGWRLNDDQVAGVLSVVRSNRGNHAGTVTASDVAKVRATMGPATVATARR